MTLSLALDRRIPLRRLLPALVASGLALAGLTVAAGPARAAVPTPAQDPFYTYTGTTPLTQIAPGTVLKTRTLSYTVTGITGPLKVVQLLYRTTDSLGGADTDVTSVIEPPGGIGSSPHLVGYGSYYDSLNTDDDPSYAISAGAGAGDGLEVPSEFILPLLRAGDTIDVSDDEGEGADFGAGPEAGYVTLDSLRAALASSAVGLPGSTPVGMFGYSGGAVAVGWAAQLAPTYAPDINDRLVGTALGGDFLADFDHTLQYISGSSIWSGVMPLILNGLARAYDIDLTPYLSTYGAQVLSTLQNASIGDAVGAYPGLTWQQLAKPQYPEPSTIPAYVTAANQQIMGETPTTTPLYIGQGAGGSVEGTSGTVPGIGVGDGIGVAGDVRTVALKDCAAGGAVQYEQYNRLAHEGSAAFWLLGAWPWLKSRFAGQTAPQNCSSIAPGNSLAPLPVGATGR